MGGLTNRIFPSEVGALVSLHHEILRFDIEGSRLVAELMALGLNPRETAVIDAVAYFDHYEDVASSDPSEALAAALSDSERP